jgi:hypothetical protein
MSPRKPTIDGLDDVDDQDGSLEEEMATEKDLTLHVKQEDEVALGHSDPAKDEYVEDERE